MPEYKYGTYGEIVESVVQPTTYAETIPVYFGTAPVHLVKGWKDKGLVNHPVKVKNLTEATQNVGYCGDFETYTLCEAFAAHFDSGTEGIGPIYVVNVLDPDAAKTGAPTTQTLNFVNGRAVIPGTETIVDSVQIKKPFENYAKNGFVKNAKDAEIVFKAHGKDATGKIKNDQIFYWAFEKTIDKKTDIIIEIEAKGKKYGCLDIGKNRGTNVTIAYMSLKAGDHDFVDGAASKEALDLTGYTGDVKMTLYECKATDTSTYPTNLKEIESTTMTFVDGDSFQYYELGEDYEIAYNAQRGGVLIQDLTGEMAKTPEATFDTVDPTQVTPEDVAGEVTLDGKLTGIESLKLLFMETGEIANLLAAPGWSDKEVVCKALSKAARKMNGHWDAMYIVDIPLEDEGAIDTMDKAIAWKQKHAIGGRVGDNTLPYNDERSKVCWPMAIDADGRIFHISTLTVVEMLRTDQENDGFPFETPGNKSVAILKQYFGPDSRNNGFDQRESDAICSKGITTVIPWATHWHIWGDHTAAYNFDDDGLDPRCIFDVSMRMLMHITNSFQKEWAQTIDEPTTRSLIDTIINREQEKLDQLVSMGALIGKPVVQFVEEENPTSEMMHGNFVWNISVTPTPPLKSATVKVGYTDEGFVSYWGEE